MPRGQADHSMSSMGDLLDALNTPGANLRETYKDDPVGLALHLGLKLPKKPVQVMQELGVYDPELHGLITPGLRDLVEDVCRERIASAVAVANRGGGKSQGVSFIEFFLVFIKDYDALNLGGSELQADQVYQYIVSYIESNKEFRSMVKGESLASRTDTIRDAWIRVLTASQKSVRSPHAGGRKPNDRMAGGILVIDEEAEAAPEIVAAALPTINTARPSVNVRASTFHNAEGSFAEVMDNATEMGYQVYKWDIFDVAERCECVDKCESTEPCFRDDHFERTVDPETGAVVDQLLHRAYCQGRAMYADGWIPVIEIETLWRRMKRNHAVWEVEAMGSRPSSKGFVIKDPTSFGRNLVDASGEELYMPGWPATICVDWGSIAAGVTVWQEQPGDRHAMIHCEQLEEAGSSQITAAILTLKERFAPSFQEVAADIGGGGNYMNPMLRDSHQLTVRDVNFAEVKEAAVAAWNVYNESQRLIVPKEYGLFVDQVRKWKRVNGRIQKGNDHLCDSTICYFAKFIDRLGLSYVRVPPRSGSTAPHTTLDDRRAGATGRVGPARAAVVRTLGSRRSR